MRAERPWLKSELAGAIGRMNVNLNEPYLLDVIVETKENKYPMIPAGGSYRDITMGADDMPGRLGREAKQGSNV